jgi:hypothetical protein
VRCTLGDVVYLRVIAGVVAPVLIVLVEPADGPFLDGTPRTAIGVLSWWLSLVLGWGIWAEIAISGRCRAAALGPRCPSAWTRSKAAASAGWGAARSRSIPARTWTAGRTLLTRPSLAHSKRSALEGLLIESTDGGFCDRAIGVINERESSRPTGFTIHRENDLGGFTDARQVLSQLCLGRRVRQVAYKQTDWHWALLVRA